MKKVKMLSALVFQNNFSLQPRQIIELEDSVADNFIAKNLAILIEEQEEKVEKKPRKPRKKKGEVLI